MADLKLLEKLCRAFAPSGNESAVREIIIDEISDYCTKLKIDKAGNLIAFIKGTCSPENKMLFCSHMDEVALMVSGYTEDGCLTFEEVGGIDERILPAKRVIIGSHPGVIASKPIHQMSKEERSKPRKMSELSIDIGALSKEEAQSAVAIGDYVCFDEGFEYFGSDRVLGKAIDDRAGCMLLCELIKKPLPYDITAVFSVREECGLRGAAVAAFAERPDIAVAIDSTTASDIPGAEGAKKICVQGEGGVLSVIDGATVYDRDLISTLKKSADSAGVKYQIKRLPTGGNDSAALQRAASGAKVLSLSAPARYIHSPCGTVRKSDLDSMAELLMLAVREFGQERTKNEHL